MIQLAPEPSPPRIVLALEQSQGGHLIPAWGGGLWLSPPRPFDWTAVIGERQLGGGAGRGQPWLTQLSPPSPAPPVGVAGSQVQKE